MKIELLQEEGRTVGWEIIAENEQERRILGSMRNVEFWGTGDTKIEYAGRVDYEPDDRYVHSLKYATKGYKEKKKREFREKLMNEVSNQDDEE